MVGSVLLYYELTIIILIYDIFVENLIFFIVAILAKNIPVTLIFLKSPIHPPHY